MATGTRLVERETLRTESGRDIAVVRYGPGALSPGPARIVLDTACLPYDRIELWAVLTPAEARRLAAVLVAQADAADQDTAFCRETVS
ncbi:hypothetical protein ABT095_38205 [Kitasatospora sp. NPDC002227]|uniref:hypothetical protein n=1 Tax=Kitasatospora sp. NPDC002227 TaxID=3154773 RepID=UPI00331ADC72